MTNEVLLEIKTEIEKQDITHGKCTVCFTFHDGRLRFYELQFSKRKNIQPNKQLKIKTGGDGFEKMARK